MIKYLFMFLGIILFVVVCGSFVLVEEIIEEIIKIEEIVVDMEDQVYEEEVNLKNV